MPDGLDRFLTTADVAQTLQVQERTVRAMLKRGDLPGLLVGRHWRIPERRFVQWLDDRITGAV